VLQRVDLRIGVLEFGIALGRWGFLIGEGKDSSCNPKRLLNWLVVRLVTD